MSDYQEIIRSLRKDHFLSPNGKNAGRLLALIGITLKSAIDHQGEEPIYHVENPHKSIYQIAAEARIPDQPAGNLKALLATISEHLGGSVIAHDPFMAKNIIPLPDFSYLAAYVAASLYMPNGVTGEDAAAVLNTEIACASALAKLAGYNFNRSAGIFTFGGTGTNFYALKLGLMKAAPDHNLKGLGSIPLVVIGTRSSHYCHQTSSNWLGIGQDNYLQASTNLDQTTRLDDLERLCRQAIAEGKRIACIEALGGTTSNMAIDDIETICHLRDSLVSDYKLDYTPHVHVDSVVGWAYLFFKDYDFDANPLGFSPRVLEKVKMVYSHISKVKYADSFGVDFHKTGYTPYVSSMIIAKDQKDFKLLRRDAGIMTPLFHNDSVYNPGVFTLETSRSAANMLATWYVMQALGRDGYRSLLGHSLEMSFLMRDELSQYEETGLYAVNREHFGCDIFVRCYPASTVPHETYQRELDDDQILENNTAYNNRFAKWFLQKKQAGPSRISLSKSSAAFYNNNGKPVVALRIYSLNPNLDQIAATEMIARLAAAKREFDASSQS